MAKQGVNGGDAQPPVPRWSPYDSRLMEPIRRQPELCPEMAKFAFRKPTAVLLLILVIVLIHASHDSLRSSLLLNTNN